MNRNLVILDPAGVWQLEFKSSRISLGRFASNDLVLDDPLVSRRHATLEVCGEVTWLVDHGSSNGVLLNGKKVIGCSPVFHRDILLIGNTRVRFTEQKHNHVQWRDLQLDIAPMTSEASV